MLYTSELGAEKWPLHEREYQLKPPNPYSIPNWCKQKKPSLYDLMIEIKYNLHYNKFRRAGMRLVFDRLYRFVRFATSFIELKGGTTLYGVHNNRSMHRCNYCHWCSSHSQIKNKSQQ